MSCNMEKCLDLSMETVFNCVIPYIHDGDDRNSVSLVCRKWYELDCMTRKHVTVHLFYSPSQSSLHQRFPFLGSLTLKGLPSGYKYLSDIDITPWIEEIYVSFRCLKSLHIRHVYVYDSDLKLLASTCGKDLSVLKICKCKGFSTDGLLHIGEYCNDLRTLCLKENEFDNKDGKWLHELALQNTGIESLDFRDFKIHDVKDLKLLAKNCCRSLVSLKITAGVDLINLVDVFRHAIRLEDFVGGKWAEDHVYGGFEFPKSMGVCDLTGSSFPFVLPFAHQLKELYLLDVHLDAYGQRCLIRRCPNLEVLYTTILFGDMGLQAIGRFCKKLRKFKSYGYGWATQMGLIDMVKGCLELECLHINLTDISNEIFVCIGTHLKNLRDFRMTLNYKDSKPTSPIDDGIRAMLIGCGKLQRLGMRLHHGGLTSIGLGYIGKYGHNLRYLSLGYVGEYAAATGLVCLSKGCPKLRKLEIQCDSLSNQTIAPIVYDMHMLRYMSVRNERNGINLAMTHPNFNLKTS